MKNVCITKKAFFQFLSRITLYTYTSDWAAAMVCSQSLSRTSSVNTGTQLQIHVYVYFYLACFFSMKSLNYKFRWIGSCPNCTVEVWSLTSADHSIKTKLISRDLGNTQRLEPGQKRNHDTHHFHSNSLYQSWIICRCWTHAIFWSEHHKIRRQNMHIP